MWGGWKRQFLSADMMSKSLYMSKLMAKKSKQKNHVWIRALLFQINFQGSQKLWLHILVQHLEASPYNNHGWVIGVSDSISEKFNVFPWWCWQYSDLWRERKSTRPPFQRFKTIWSFHKENATQLRKFLHIQGKNCFKIEHDKVNNIPFELDPHYLGKTCEMYANDLHTDTPNHTFQGVHSIQYNDA